MEALTSHPLVHDRLAVDQTRSAFVMLVLPNVPGIELPEELMIPLLVKIRTIKVAHDLLISSSSTSAVRRFDAEVVEKKYSPLSPAEPHLDTSS